MTLCMGGRVDSEEHLPSQSKLSNSCCFSSWVYSFTPPLTFVCGGGVTITRLLDLDAVAIVTRQADAVAVICICIGIERVS